MARGNQEAALTRGQLGGRSGSQVIAVRVRNEQRAALEALAEREGVEVSELMREALADRIAVGPRRRLAREVMKAA